MTWFVLAAFFVLQAPQPKIDISLSRTVCFGTCPEYTVKMTEDGSVTYTGKKFVRVDGVHTWNIDPRAVRALADEMVKGGFFDLRDSYSSGMSDHATVYTTLVLDGRSKSIRDYITGPPQLKQIERRIDMVAGTKRYVSIDSATIRGMARTGWRAIDEQALGWLWSAAYAGDADVLGALLAAGADARAMRADGTTILMAAAMSGDPECVRRLIADGADPTFRDGSGLNAADYVRQQMKATPLFPGTHAVESPTVDATGLPKQYDLILKLLTNE
jgi:hypothetical protein